MKHFKLITLGILIGWGIFYSFEAMASTLTTSGSCNSITITSSAKDIGWIEKDGLTIWAGLNTSVSDYWLQSFTDRGNNYLYLNGTSGTRVKGWSPGFFPNSIKPNHNYSYVVHTADGQGGCSSYICWPGWKAKSITVKSECPAGISASINVIKTYPSEVQFSSSPSMSNNSAVISKNNKAESLSNNLFSYFWQEISNFVSANYLDG